PPRRVTPRSKPISFIAIWPWSWYIVSTASNAPLLARRKTVSAGNGPSTKMPLVLACLHHWGDHVDLLAPEITAIAGVRVETSDCNARTREAGAPHTSVR